MESLKTLLGADFSSYPTEFLDTLNRKISSELCKRRQKNAITLLKEWEDKNRQRKVRYDYQFITRGTMRGKIYIEDEHGFRMTSGDIVHTDPEEPELKRVLKHKLAEAGLVILKDKTEGLMINQLILDTKPQLIASVALPLEVDEDY